MARHLHAQTGLKNLCLAGGVALNCVANGRLLREGPFENGSGCSRRPGTPAGRWARRCLSGTSCSKTRARPARPTASTARCWARNSPTTEMLAVLAECGAVYQCVEDEASCAGDGRADRRRQGGRLGPGPDGIRPARPRQPQHPRRRPQPRHAVHHEPEDQVPGIVPALRSGGAGRAGAANIST
jgi:carbamoyltransferase